MRFFNFLSISSLIAATSAYTVLSPTADAAIEKGKSTSVSWTSVDTDASDFSIYLVNFQAWPPIVISLAQDVPQAAGSIDVHIPCDVSSSAGWQINFINGTNTYVIYAQGSAFSLTGSCVDPTTSSSVSVATTTAYATKNSTITATATATGTVVSQVVSTVTFTSPIVWFVESTTIGSMCAPEKTVTVYASGPAPSGTGVAGGSSGGYGNYTSSAIVKPSSTGSVPKSSSTGTLPPITANGAGALKAGGVLGGLMMAIAFLL